jgi:flavin reductase (DIM6/NTAB) family NADH-FMN oxidoreductase RutF
MLRTTKERAMEQTRSEILKTIPYGFYITGVVGADGEANGFTTCWVSQVSFEPQQLVVAVRRDQHTHELMEQGGVFSLNFLDTEQEVLARRFTKPLGPGDGTVGGSVYTTGKTGAPLFEEAFAHLECRVVGKMEAGDHTVYLGEVASANLRRPADILTDLDTTMEYGG